MSFYDGGAKKDLNMDYDPERSAEVWCPSGYIMVGLNYKTVDSALYCALEKIYSSFRSLIQFQHQSI